MEKSEGLTCQTLLREPGAGLSNLFPRERFKVTFRGRVRQEQ